MLKCTRWSLPCCPCSLLGAEKNEHTASCGSWDLLGEAWKELRGMFGVVGSCGVISELRLV